jgi:uncharacterized membrane protein
MTAVVAGVVFIIATVAQVAGVIVVRPILDAEDYLASIAANESQVFLSALLQFIGAVSCAGIALALYPVLRNYNHGLAMGSVGFRVIEGTLHVLIAVCLLMLVTLSEEAVRAGATGSPAYLVPGEVLKAGRDWLAPVAVLSFGFGGLMYYWVFFQSRLIPRWLSAWGLVGVVSVMLSGVLVMFQTIGHFSTAQVVLAAPIGLQEMVLALWLIVKGFNTSAAAEPARQRSAMPAAA